MKVDLTQEIKTIALSEGACLFGVAPVERFQDAPSGQRPHEILPKARNVVVIGLKLLNGIVETLPSRPYALQYTLLNNELNRIALKISRYLEAQGYRSLPIPASGYMLPRKLMGEISHRHAAVMAGLGELGVSNLLITREFGPRVRLVSVVTEAPLKSSPLIQNRVCNRCYKCVEACPVHALTTEGVLDKKKCWKQLIKTGKKLGVSETICGICVKVCPIGR
ncbi:MAG: 4Fe-4S binding protein [Candidatus Bathyarchaeia archaeon]